MTPLTAARWASLSFTHLPELVQTHSHSVSDAIQPSYPLLSPSSPAFSLSQHQSFQMSQLFTSGGQSIGVSASESVSPVNIQGWFPLELTGFISLQSKELWRVFSNITVQKFQSFGTQVFFMAQLSHPYMTIGKTIALTIWAFTKLWVHNYTSILGILQLYSFFYVSKYLLY